MLDFVPTFSAGVLLHRRRDADGVVEVLIAHPGGPFWARKDAGAWSVVKGEYADDEEPWDAARREFREEVGLEVPGGEPVRLTPIRQRAGKVVTVFALDADLDVTNAVSNEFEMEWPPKSGRTASFPEVDRVEWMSVAQARDKLLAAQMPLLDELMALPESAGSVEGTA